MNFINVSEKKMGTVTIHFNDTISTGFLAKNRKEMFQFFSGSELFVKDMTLTT